MNKEQIIERLRHGSGVAKDCVVKQYHCFADFLAKKKIESQNNGCTIMFGMRCSKYVFILMNIFYLVSKHYIYTLVYTYSKKFYLVDITVHDIHGIL